eukprot:3209397-Prymnesium_polylepis.1
MEARQNAERAFFTPCAAGNGRREGRGAATHALDRASRDSHTYLLKTSRSAVGAGGLEFTPHTSDPYATQRPPDLRPEPRPPR